MREDFDERPVRDWVGWEFLAGIALLVGGPIVIGLDRILVLSTSSGRGLEVAGAVMVGVSVLMLLHVNVLNAFDLHTAFRGARDLVPFFAMRQVRFVVVAGLAFLVGAGLARLERAEAESFVGAAIGVLGGLILIFTLDNRFMPQDERWDE